MRRYLSIQEAQRLITNNSSSRKRKVGDVDVSVDVDALERDDRLSKDEVNRRYETSRQQQSSTNPWARVDQDDLSQMIQDESRKRIKKDEEKRKKK
jgi:splicing factor 3B subunit 2